MPAPRKDYSKAVEMYNDGLSVPKIAARHGMSNQAMYNILKRRGVKFRKMVAGKPCSVKGCSEPVKAKGYCSRHVYQFYKYGRIISDISLRNKHKKCSVAGCNRKHKANGFCNAHNLQVAKHGRVISEKLADRNGVSKSGEYVLILKPDHHEANKRGYVLRSHLVWEKHTGHIVVSPEVIHHISGIKNDDRFENLKLFASDIEHQKTVHRKKRCIE